MYATSVAPLPWLHSINADSTQAIDFLHCHNLPTLISTWVHSQVRLMDLQDICVQSSCKPHLDIKSSAIIISQAECIIQENGTFLLQLCSTLCPELTVQHMVNHMQYISHQYPTCIQKSLIPHICNPMQEVVKTMTMSRAFLNDPPL